MRSRKAAVPIQARSIDFRFYFVLFNTLHFAIITRRGREMGGGGGFSGVQGKLDKLEKRKNNNQSNMLFKKVCEYYTHARACACTCTHIHNTHILESTA